MKDLTKLFCDLISFGSGIECYSGDIQTAMSSLAGIVLYEDVCEVGKLDYDAIREHIESLRSAHRGSDYDIDNVRNRLAQGKPVSIKRIVEFHNKFTVTLSDDKQLSFNATDIVHY